MSRLSLVVNGQTRAVDVDADCPLLYVLRDDLALNNPRFGCGLGQCGACTVVVDKQAIFSCVTPVSLVAGKAVQTVEGLGTAEKPGALQQAFIDEQAAQCGYCIAGMIMRAQALIERGGRPSEDAIRAHMQANLCRCGTHMRILAAVRKALGGARIQSASSEKP
jgi:aerobic-type carbon monoxide dehydrogenase small subunit (CoxS/CutS family)